MHKRKLTTRVSFVVGSIAVVVAVVACSGKTAASSAGTSSSGAPVSQSVGSAGGTVTSSDGKATVTIPPGALSSNVTITLAALGTAAVAGATEVGGAYQLGPAGTTFAKPVTVTLPYDATAIPAPATSSSVLIFTAEDGSSTFARMPTTVVDGSHVSASSTHFSTYVAGVPSDASAGDAGSVVPPQCDNVAVQCRYGENIDGGIGCDCGLTCDGVAYDIQCICGACTCYQDQTAVGTATIANDVCGGLSTGISLALVMQYFNTCKFPGSKNMGGGGGGGGNNGGTCP